MKDFYVGVVFFAIIAWGMTLFIGLILGFPKSFRSSPQYNRIEMQQMRKIQKQRSEDMKRQYKMTREDHRRKMRNSRRNF